MKLGGSFALLLLPLLVDVVAGHVALTFPRARQYDLDFLDNARTPGPCGMPKGDIKTSLLSGSTFNVTWHLAYPHKGGFRLHILDALDRPLVDLTPVTKQTEFVKNDATAQSYLVELPTNFTCTDCTIRLLREAEEWGSSYRFWSCADVDIVEKKTYREDCSGHGRLLVHRCRCDRLYHGSRCQYRQECLDDSDCGTQGSCVDHGGTSSPSKQCYCNVGWFGPGCSKRSPVKSVDLDLDSYATRRFSQDVTFYWRVLKDTKEFEGVLVANSTTWLGVGWRPSGLTAACRAVPEIRDPRPKGAGPEPLPRPEPKAEPEPEPEPAGTEAPASSPEPEPEYQRSAGNNKRSASHEVTPSPADGDVTVQTSVTYRVSTREGRRKRSALPDAAPTTYHKYAPKHDFNPMDCTDIIIGSARGMKHRIGDYYTRDRSTPRLDSFWGGSDSLTAAMGFERDGVTTILFRRKLAGDGHFSDHEIADGPMQVIWARGQEPGKYVHVPASGVEQPDKVSVADFYKADELKYHGHKTQRGVVTIDFLEENREAATPDSGNDCSGEWHYPRHCSVENGTCDYSARWTYNAVKDKINFTIITKDTDHWTGIGFSKNEKMSQTDAVLGWVDKGSGRAFLSDTWINGYDSPVLDSSQDIMETSGRLENGRTVLKFSRKRVTNDNRDLSFTDDQCLHFMFPVQGGLFNAVNKKIKVHAVQPIVSAQKICIKACPGSLDNYGESTTSVPRTFYSAQVRLIDLGANYQVPMPGSSEFEDLSNRLNEGFEPILRERVPGFHELQLVEVTKSGPDGIVAKLNLAMNRNDVKSRESKRPEETSLALTEVALKEALARGRVGALTVDRHYLVFDSQQNTLGGAENDLEDEGSENFLVAGLGGSTTKLYTIVACLAALLALALLQASCTLYRASKKRTTKDRLINKNAWKDYSASANTNFAFEAFEEKAPPPPAAVTAMSSLPRRPPADGPAYHQPQMQQRQSVPPPAMAPRATYSLPRAPGPRQPPAAAPAPGGYYTQDRRGRYAGGGRANGQGAPQPQPDFYFMPSQRKYSGEVVRVYVDYGNQKQPK